MGKFEKMISTYMRRELVSLKGSYIKNANLIVWPDELGLLDNDMRLNIVVDNSKELTFYISSDAQTPMVKYETIVPHYDIDQLYERLTEWKKDDYWSLDKNIEPEKFKITKNNNYFDIIDKRIINFGILVYDDKTPTGLSILFEDETEIYILPGETRGMVTTSFDHNIFAGKVNMIHL